MTNYLINAIFKMESIYGEQQDNTPSEDVQYFQEEAKEILSELGFTFAVGEDGTVSTRGELGRESVQIGAMEIEAVLTSEGVEKVKEGLNQMVTAVLKTVESNDKRYAVTTDEAVALMNQKFRRKAYERLFEGLKTTRKNKFVRLEAKTPPIKTVDESVAKEAYNLFVDDLVGNLIEKGLVIPKQGANRTYRSLNKTELKDWERKNGDLNFEAM